MANPTDERLAAPGAGHSRPRVVDFETFRRSRARAPLPLFDGIRPAGPALVTRLTSRDVAHRRRMLDHLGAMLSGCRS